MVKIRNNILFIHVLVLSIFGIIMIYSASNYSASLSYNDSFYFVKKQVYALILSIIGYFVAKNISLDSIKNSTNLIYILSVILLALVFVPKIGVENYGAKRWINLGFTTFQPSELAKFSLVMMIAKILDKNSSNTYKCIFKILLFSSVIVLLILLEPNMSIAITIMLVVFIMLIAGGMNKKQVLFIVLPIIIAFAFLIILEPYRVKRLTAFVDPFKTPLNEGYQLIQSYYALAGGGITGVGLFNSRQKYLFLPFSESDFIFSIIGEELGFLGCMFTIILILLIIFQAFKIAISAKDRYSTYLAFGITSIIFVQSLLNIAVVSGSVPPTGLPLPFVSYGGSSLNVFFFFIGVLQNISNKALKKYPLNRIY